MSAAVWQDGEDIILKLYIQPKASRDKVVGLHGEELKSPLLLHLSMAKLMHT